MVSMNKETCAIYKRTTFFCKGQSMKPSLWSISMKHVRTHRFTGCKHRQRIRDSRVQFIGVGEAGRYMKSSSMISRVSKLIIDISVVH
jgi:tRNA A37 threonylcarbamoyladenosine dehydratase